MLKQKTWARTKQASVQLRNTIKTQSCFSTSRQTGCYKKYWGAMTLPELWLYLQWKGVSHAISLISTNMLTTFSMLKSSHRSLKSWSIYASKFTTCWANMLQSHNQYPDYNMALSCIQLLKQTWMSQYEPICPAVSKQEKCQYRHSMFCKC